MFGYCVWLEFLKNHSFYSINRTLAYVLGTQIHNPHITVDYNIDKNKGLEKIKSHKPNKLYACGNIYSSKTANFYSLQQNYIRENDFSKMYHVSLVYRVDKPFTKKEINYANSMKVPKIITPQDVNVNLWNCDSIYTKDWYRVNL